MLLSRSTKGAALVVFFCVQIQCCASLTSNATLFKCLGRLVDGNEKQVDVPGVFMSDGAQQSFRLERKELNCRKDRFKVILESPHSQDVSFGKMVNSLATAKVLKTDPKSWKTNVIEDASIKIMRDTGYLQVGGNEFFHPVEYCFDQVEGSELSLFVCYPLCYLSQPCISKCCGEDEVWDVWNMRCRKFDALSVNPSNGTVGSNETLDRDMRHASSGVSTRWTPFLFSRSVDNCVKKVTDLHREQISVHYQQHLPSCDPSEYVMVPLRKIHNYAFHRFRVLWTGGVIVRNKNGSWSQLNQGRYCVDGMVNFDKYSSGAYTGAFEDQVIIACKDEIQAPVLKKPIPLKFSIILLVSAFILFVTVLISCLLWDKQNVYEWTISCEVISMFFLITFLWIANTIARRPEKSDFGSPHCVFIGAASHFFWLSTFCWLFIINFEIWWNFRSIVKLYQSRKFFRFSIYNLVGWGCPLVAVLIGLFLDRTWGLQNEDLDCAGFTPPNYGQLNCYVSKPAQGVYIYYPIGVVLVFNLLFYLTTMCKMWSYQKKSNSMIQYRSKNQTQPIIIFAKLFIVMGVSWVFEVVAWAVTPTDADKIPLYWVIFDIVSLFQSVSIFVIFCWKKEVLSMLWWTYPRAQLVLKPCLSLPGCVLLPSDRERAASIHHHMQQQVNKVSRDQTASLRNGGSTTIQPGSITNGALPDTGIRDQMAFSAL